MPTSHLRWKVWKVEGFFVNLFPVASDSTEVPLSQAYGLPAQHKARPAGALSGEPEKIASLEKGGGPAKLVEGFFVKSFYDIFQYEEKFNT